ncbi:MAG TPA: hypothetical protein VI603_05630 [Saprospiraceae bacterium]|nr:hypothetical protein [Saprospiraceae bacterium]
MEDNRKKSRRKFLVAGVSLGAGTLLGAQVVKELTTPEEVVLITSDGKLVRVDRKYLPQSTGKKSSNKDLEEWKKL